MTRDAIRIACAEEMGWTKEQIKAFQVVSSLVKEQRNLQQPRDSFSGLEIMGKIEEAQAAKYYIGSIPSYPTDANAALTLCDFLEEKGCKWIAMNVETGVQFIFLRKKNGILNGEEFEATASTLPLAICEAFLRWRGKWKETE